MLQNLEEYIQSLVLKKTSESISLDRRRLHDWSETGEDEIGKAVEKLFSQRLYESNIIEEMKFKNYKTKCTKIIQQ